jgi:dipeptidyl aminopeptidase/acylaminoacyl peptidase
MAIGDLTMGAISYLVSNGYLVFVPDIHYTLGYPGKSANNFVVAAAQHLAKYRWVDKTKMALHGHSFGGFETCYIVTHTNLFAAACASSPMTDFVSAYGSIIYGHPSNEGGISRQKAYEVDRDRIGKNLWEGQHFYIENSPVLKANRITTPLVIMANDGDGDVPWDQGIEMFTALRRLGKRAWMLQYQNEGHLIVDDETSRDFTIRIKQFFDHYLKDSAAPRWMLYGTPPQTKDIGEGLQLVEQKDENGKWLTPKEGGLLTDEEKKKAEALKHRKPVTVTIE